MEDRVPSPASRTDRIVAAVFFVAVFFFFLHPVREGDVWWHLNFGLWILDHGSIPVDEPFVYTIGSPPSPLESLSISGYWLAQLLYGTLFRYMGGFGALAFMNAAIYTTLIWAVRAPIRSAGLGAAACGVLLVPLIVSLARFDEVRPHAFSFLGAAMTFLVLDRGVRILREQPPGHAWSPRPLWPLVALMALWANLHQGFTIGILIIAVYGVSETGRLVFHLPGALTWRAWRALALWSVAAVAAVCLNPNGVHAPYLSLLNVVKLSGFKGTLMELESPLAFARFTGSWSSAVASALVGVIALVLMAAGWRRTEPSHPILLGGLAVAASGAMRFVPFFLAIGTTIAGISAARARWPRWRLGRALLTGALAPFVLYCLFASYRNLTEVSWPVMKSFLPDRAIDFMRDYRPPQPIFNPYVWGGYISYRLHPLYRVFIDPRILNYQVQGKYGEAVSGNEDAVFRDYGIKTVIFYPVYYIDRRVQPLVLSLQRDPAWRLVYADPEAVIYVREDAAGDLPTIDKELLWNHLVAFGQNEIRLTPESPAGYEILGTVAFYRGEWDNASRYLDRAEALKR